MPVRSTKVTRASALTLAAVAGSACAYALGLPPSANSGPARAVAPPRGAAVGLTAQESPRPPIETVMNRDSALRLLPRDNAGNVDWVAALRSGTIRPRAAPPGRDSSWLRPFGYDVYQRRSPASFEAFFPHSSHTAWVACGSCHPTLYRRRGDTTSMAAINQGESCGTCHRTVAFAASTCERCHEGLPGTAGRVTPSLHDDVAIPRLPDSAATRRSTSYPPARFSHAFHRIRYRCGACHDAVFAMRPGAGSMRMADMNAGAGCGACHDGTAAFALVRCERCHAPGATAPAR